MGRGTTNMYDTNHKRIGTRPIASIWKVKGQWYKLGGCCWTGWKRLPLTEPEAMATLETLRQRILSSSHGFDKAYWERDCAPRIATCPPSRVAYWARSLGVQA